jgi:hypothetical protein
LAKHTFTWDETRATARSLSHKIARDYPGIEADDIEQAILTRVTEQESMFKRMNYPPDSLRKILHRFGVKYANDERLSALNLSDQYHYTIGEVRALCGEALFDRDAFIAKVEQDAEYAANFDEIAARTVDLQTAFAALRPEQRALISKRWVENEILTPNERKALSRTMDRLVQEINRGISKRSGKSAREWHDGPGARKATSNAAARALVADAA